MKSESIDRMRSLCSFIYGEGRGAEVGRRLAEILAGREGALREKGAVGKPGSCFPAFSERDALLITYGDMVGAASPSVSPLASLGAFLSRRAAGAFSYVHVLPFFPYSSDDGFSVIDYRSVDPRIGDWNDFGALERNFKLAFDLVLNHGSARSRWFADFLSGVEPHSTWYLTRPSDYDSSVVFRPRTHPLLTSFNKADGTKVSVWTTFSADQVDFDFGVPEVLLEFVSIFLEFVERGGRLIRLDAIAYLWKEDGTPCIHHPKTHAVVKLLRSVVDALGLDVVILTETNVAHPDNISYFGDGDEAHMVYNFALPPLLLHAAVSGDAGPLRRWAATLPPSDSGATFLNFTASHDGIGLGPARSLVPDADFSRTIVEAERRGGRVSFKSTSAGPVPYELNCVYLDAVAPPKADPDTRARAFLATQAVMLSLAGLPAVYFHSWVGSENWSEGVDRLGYNRAINRAKPDLSALERELDDPSSLRSLVNRRYGALLAFRAERPCFASRSPQRILDAEGAVFALVRGPDASGRSVLCAHNLSDKSATCAAPAEFGAGLITLGPWETRWIDSAEGGQLCI